jgi:hypothetical protein
MLGIGYGALQYFENDTRGLFRAEAQYCHSFPGLLPSYKNEHLADFGG